MSYHLFIYGKVESEWFRESMRQEAERLHLTGWCRPAGDGRVEAVIHGDEEAMEFMIQWCHRGTGAADVARVEVQESTEPGNGHFELR